VFVQSGSRDWRLPTGTHEPHLITRRLISVAG
jgi:hypothetical protein